MHAASLFHHLADDPARIACRAPLAPALATLLGVDDEALVADPRTASEALVVGSAVLRPARESVTREVVRRRGIGALAEVSDWCHDVEGLPAGAVVSAGSRLDAIRLALHYGLSDAILVGSATVAAEGLPRDGLPGWRWHASTPLDFPVLAGIRASLEAGIRATRRAWQVEGRLSARAAPALIVVTRGRDREPPPWLQAPALREGEAVVLTTQAGVERFEGWRRAGAEQLPETLGLLAASPQGDPEALDLGAVPRLLRERLGVRLAGHDGGRSTLAAFSRAAVLHQLNLVFVGSPPIAVSHPGHVGRHFFSAGVPGPARAPSLTLLGAEEDAWLVQYEVRGGELP